jgi:N4-gp56 family major capsid protein
MEYEREVAYRQMVDKTFFSKFMGDFKKNPGGGKSGKDSPVYVKTALEKSRGDKITFYKKWALEGDGVRDDEILKGNEEQLHIMADEVELHLDRHAVADEGALDRQRAAYDINDEMFDSLSEWGTQKIDKLSFDAIQSSPTKTIYYTDAAGVTAANGTSSFATAKAALVAAQSKLTPDLVRATKTWAENGGTYGRFRIPPAVVDGEEVYVMCVNPNAMYDLKIHSDYEAWLKEAR